MKTVPRESSMIAWLSGMPAQGNVASFRAPLSHPVTGIAQGRSSAEVDGDNIALPHRARRDRHSRGRLEYRNI
jgi:hypothetical protein